MSELIERLNLHFRTVFAHIESAGPLSPVRPLEPSGGAQRLERGTKEQVHS